MGSPMAANLGRRRISRYSGTTSATSGSTRLVGGRRAGRGRRRRGGADADVVITMLPDSPAGRGGRRSARAACWRTRGPARCCIDMTSIRPRDLASAWRRAAAERGVRVLDAPVSAAARRARSTACCRSWSAARGRLRRRRSRCSRRSAGRSSHVGPHGAGQTVKAANQLVVAGTYALVAEAIVLLETSGVDAAAGLDVLAGGLAGSRDPRAQAGVDGGTASSRRASASTCTTRTWASCSMPPGRPTSRCRSAPGRPAGRRGPRAGLRRAGPLGVAEGAGEPSREGGRSSWRRSHPFLRCIRRNGTRRFVRRARAAAWFLRNSASTSSTCRRARRSPPVVRPARPCRSVRSSACRVPMSAALRAILERARNLARKSSTAMSWWLSTTRLAQVRAAWVFCRAAFFSIRALTFRALTYPLDGACPRGRLRRAIFRCARASSAAHRRRWPA